MGLDMYLKANKYLAGYEWIGEAERAAYKQVSGVFPYASTDRPSATVSVVIAYWRKANSIHKWFVDNVQDGVDKCEEHGVSRSQLEELLVTCKQVLSTASIAGKKASRLSLQGAYKLLDVPDGEEPEVLLDNELAQELLPSQSGFFFGDTGFNGWYVTDLIDTKDMLTAILKAYPEDNSMTRAYFTYQSSW